MKRQKKRRTFTYITDSTAKKKEKT